MIARRTHIEKGILVWQNEFSFGEPSIIKSFWVVHEISEFGGKAVYAENILTKKKKMLNRGTINIADPSDILKWRKERELDGNK